MIVSKGVAGVEIVRIAEAVDADLVVIGPPRRWTSTAHAVLSTPRCPVLVTHDARPLPRPVIRETHGAVGMNLQHVHLAHSSNSGSWKA